VRYRANREKTRRKAAESSLRAILDVWDEFESIDPQLIINALSPHMERARSILQRFGRPT
jgi:hypothetical protein